MDVAEAAEAAAAAADVQLRGADHPEGRGRAAAQ